MVLQVLRENQLYENLRKCGFYWRNAQYLGHVISEEEITVDMEKIKSIMDYIKPNNVTYVIYFMGLAGYYRRFIEGFSKIAHPITSLKRKKFKFVWSEKCEASFQRLKNFLSNYPILKTVDKNKDFVVCTNSCIEGLGGVLT